MTTIMVVIRDIENGVETFRLSEKFMDGTALEKFFRRQKKERPQSHFHLVNCTTPTDPPKDFSQTKTIWWCPYCAKGRWFLLDARFNLFRCNVCLISERDFYVKKWNPRIPKRVVSETSDED